jgi:hypothetical protein
MTLDAVADAARSRAQRLPAVCTRSAAIEYRYVSWSLIAVTFHMNMSDRLTRRRSLTGVRYDARGCLCKARMARLADRLDICGKAAALRDTSVWRDEHMRYRAGNLAIIHCHPNPFVIASACIGLHRMLHCKIDRRSRPPQGLTCDNPPRPASHLPCPYPPFPPNPPPSPGPRGCRITPDPLPLLRAAPPFGGIGDHLPICPDTGPSLSKAVSEAAVPLSPTLGVVDRLPLDP